MRSVLGPFCLVSVLMACSPATAPRQPSASPANAGRLESKARVKRPVPAPAPPASHAANHEAPPAPPPTSSDRAARTVGVRGITGSLTAFEVEQAMNARTAALLACVKQRRPRSLGHVAGDIAFHIVLDGRGMVEVVSITKSDIGHAALEDCLAEVVATAPFPAPAGAERAETQWRMSVEPLGRPAPQLDAAELEETLESESAASYESCQIAKSRRFEIVGYLGPSRRLEPVSVRLPWRGKARTPEVTTEQLTCLTEALRRWTHWPKARGRAKLSFELRWQPPPPPKRHVRPGRKVRRGR